MSVLDRILPLVQNLPFHRALGLAPIEAADGQARLRLTIDERSANPSGALHGGVLYALCDIACYVALLTELQDGEDAVTHNIQVSVMRAARRGETVEVQGRVLKRGRSLAFMEAEARTGDRVLARASLTKSIVRPDSGKP